MSKWKYVIIAVLLAIPTGWALRAQTSRAAKPSPEGATGRSFLVALDISEGGAPTTILQGGHYDDVYVKTPQGWRLKSRTYIPSEIGPQPVAR